MVFSTKGLLFIFRMSDSRNYRESGLTKNNMKYHNRNGTNRLSAISGIPVVYHSVGETPGRNRVVPDQQKNVRSTLTAQVEQLLFQTQLVAYWIFIERIFQMTSRILCWNLRQINN